MIAPDDRPTAPALHDEAPRGTGETPSGTPAKSASKRARKKRASGHIVEVDRGCEVRGVAVKIGLVLKLRVYLPESIVVRILLQAVDVQVLRRVEARPVAAHAIRGCRRAGSRVPLQREGMAVVKESAVRAGCSLQEGLQAFQVQRNLVRFS